MDIKRKNKEEMGRVHDNASAFIKHENKYLMPIVNLLFKPSWMIGFVMYITKPANEGTSLREAENEIVWK